MAAEAANGETKDRHLCVLVTLDVKNTFNTASWGLIDEAYAGIELPKYIRRIIHSYLTDRYILGPLEGRLVTRRMTCGVPQGSVLEPTLWNIFYDGVLRLRLPEGASTIGFADDLSLLVINHTMEGLEANTNRTLRIINDWIARSELSLAHHKTEAVMLTRKWAYREPVFLSGGLRVPIRRTVKYLEVTLDSRLTFTAHIRAVSLVAINSTKAIGRLMLNIGGPSGAK